MFTDFNNFEYNTLVNKLDSLLTEDDIDKLINEFDDLKSPVRNAIFYITNYIDDDLV